MTDARRAHDGLRGADPACPGPKLGEVGFFGLTIPEEYGGLGGDYVTYCIGMEELGRADSSVRGIVSVSMGLFGKIVLDHGTEEQKQEWLPGIATGTRLGCFGLTEPDNGSNPGGMRTCARKDGDDWVLTGTKMWITNAGAGRGGTARDCLDAAIAYAAEREIFDKPLAAYQITQTKLADMSVELGKGMLLALQLSRLKDAGRLRQEQISLGKLNNVR